MGIWERISAYTNDGYKINLFQTEQESRKGLDSSSASGLVPVVHGPLLAFSLNEFSTKNHQTLRSPQAENHCLKNQAVEYGKVLASSDDPFLITKTRK